MTAGVTRTNAPRYTRAELIESLQALAVTLKRTPSMSDIKSGSPPALSTYITYFGTVRKAQVAAGLPLNVRGRKAGMRGY